MTASLSLFCNECGAANTLSATCCFACQEPLTASTPAPTLQPYASGYRGVTEPAMPTFIEAPRPGSLLRNRYRITREVGQGGFGVVYHALDLRRQNSPVAIKQINIGKLSTREIIDATDSYNREVSLLSRLQHRHLPRIHDHFTDSEHWYLVMDFIEGKTLEDYLKSVPGGALPLKETLDIGIQLCDVLHYLHTLKTPIIFRDVKPANVMRTPRGQIYLIDFGIARRFSPGRRRDTGALGSPGYAAPEQYGLAQTTAHTDIYGLGATLQTLVTGKEPLELQSSGSMMLVAHPPLPRYFERLLDQMLQKEVRKRPKHMEAVKIRLIRIRRGKWWPIRSYLHGLLIGIAPHVPVLGLLYATSMASFHLSSYYALMQSLLVLLDCISPFVFLAQFIWAIVMLFSPFKRFRGLGILTLLALILLAIYLLIVHSF